MEISFNRNKLLETIRANFLTYNKESKTFIVSSKPIIEARPFGTFLVEFLEYDFNKFTDFIRFFKRWGNGNFLINKTYSLNDYRELLKNEWIYKKLDLIKIQYDFKTLINFCLNIQNANYLNNLDHIKRFYIFNTISGLPKIETYNKNITTNFDIECDDIIFPENLNLSVEELACKINNSPLETLEVFEVNYFSGICYLEFKHMLLNNFTIRKCKHCGKYFIYSKKSNEIYCDRIVSGNRTCKEVGYENTLEDYKALYRTAYKRENGRFNRNKNNPTAEVKFKEWQRNELNMRIKYEYHEITFEEYKSWLGY